MQAVHHSADESHNSLGQRMQFGLLARRNMPPFPVDQAKRPQANAVQIDKRRTGVETHRMPARHDGMIPEARVFGGVGDGKHGIRLDGVSKKAIFPTFNHHVRIGVTDDAQTTVAYQCHHGRGHIELRSCHTAQKIQLVGSSRHGLGKAIQQTPSCVNTVRGNGQGQLFTTRNKAEAKRG